MGFRERLIESLGGVTKSAHERALSRAWEAGYDDGGEDEPPTSTGVVKQGYRQGGGQAQKQAITFDKGVAVAWQLWQSHPVARRYLEIKRDYIIGQGVSPIATDKDLQEILAEFWRVNHMDTHASEFAHQLFLFGAQSWPLFVRVADGFVSLGYFDPSQIEAVIPDPNNALSFRALVLKEFNTMRDWEQPHGKMVYRLVQSDADGRKVTAAQSQIEDWEQKMLRAFGVTEYAGDCLYTRVNAVSNQPMGLSDLVAVADWLDQLDDTLFALGEREQMAGFFNFDVTVEGASKDDLRARMAQLKLNPPKRGSVNLHNEKETWNCNAPDLKQGASIETVKEQLAFILGGLGLPVHWYGSGDETNRATAQAQGDPTWRSLQQAQNVVRGALVELLEFVRDQAIMAGRYTPKEGADTTITLDMPAMTVKDTTSLSAALSQMSSSLLVAQQQNWLTAEEAANTFRVMMGDLGVELKVLEEVAEPTPEEPTAKAEPGDGETVLPEAWRPTAQRMMEVTPTDGEQ